MSTKPTMTILVHGESGVGKSWFGDTAPYPRLILDAEGRAKYTPSQPKVWWDPASQAPPVADGSWSTCVVNVTTFDVLQRTFDWLRSGQHQFRSVVVDSIMEAQKRCMDQLVGMNQLQTADWGVLLRKIEGLVRSYRDLVLVESNPVEVCVFICGTKVVDDVRRPLLQGQINLTLPYYLDVVGYLYVAQKPESQELYRVLMTQPIPGYVAKDGTGRLPAAIADPRLDTMFQLMSTPQGGTAA